MRRAISLILALGLTAARAYGLIFPLFFAAGWKGWMRIASGMFLFVGIGWLYSDFINATPNDPD